MARYGRLARWDGAMAGVLVLAARVLRTGPATERRTDQHLGPRHLEGGYGEQEGGAQATGHQTHA